MAKNKRPNPPSSRSWQQDEESDYSGSCDDFDARRQGSSRDRLDDSGAWGNVSDDDEESASGMDDGDQTTSAGNGAPSVGFAQYMDSEEEAGEEGSQFSASSDEEFDNDNDQGGAIASSHRQALQRRRPQTEEDRIRQKMERVPFSTLLKAQSAMNDAQDTDSERDSLDDSEEDEFAAERATSVAQKRERMQRELEKRESKHAPTEVSTRKPVSRRRSVIETPSVQRRDPRFSSLSASQVNDGLFANSYGFLRQQQSSEVGELRKVYKQLKKQEAHHAGPRAKSEVALQIRAERERIEKALRREEGRENERLKREREAAVLRTKKKEIDERVKKGAKPFYLKEADKKRLILEDKFQRLSEGGSNGTGDTSGAAGKKHGALQRAIERRRKKNAARDHKMPLGGGAAGTSRFGFDSRDAMPPSAIPKRKRIAEMAGNAEHAQSSKTSSSRVGPRKRGRRG